MVIATILLYVWNHANGTQVFYKYGSAASIQKEKLNFAYYISNRNHRY